MGQSQPDTVSEHLHHQQEHKQYMLPMHRMMFCLAERTPFEPRL